MNGNGPGLVLGIFLALVVIGAGIGIAFAVKRHRYVTALRDRGWVFDSSPLPAVANGLLIPPFGVGLQRDTDEHVTGRTRSGVDFQVFEYELAGDARIVCMPVGLPLPELVVLAPGRVRGGVATAQQRTMPGGGVALADDPAFIDTVLGVAGAAIAAFGARYPVDLAIDGDQLTQVGAPKDPDELEAYLEALAPVAQVLQAAGPQLEPFRQPAPLMRLGFYHRPSWFYLKSDDELLLKVAHTTGGSNHRTSDVIHGEMYPGCFFVAFVHHWTTQRTVTTSGPNGTTQTQTVTDHHSEVIHEVLLPFVIPDLAVVNDSAFGRLFRGRSLDFELGAFNEAFDVFCDVPKFAYDVLHPRQIEYLMTMRTMPFTIQHGRVRPQAYTHSPEALAHELDVLVGFFARIPAFVWQDLGLAAPPLRLDAGGRVEVLTG